MQISSLDSAAAISPKYRMRMALACFLKDGTYINSMMVVDIVPYTYDSDKNDRWSQVPQHSMQFGMERKGYGNSQPIADDCDAQIYPMFDFRARSIVSPSLLRAIISISPCDGV